MNGAAQAASGKEDKPDPRAMSNLALALESGKWGRHRDEGLALKLYRRAGARGPARLAGTCRRHWCCAWVPWRG
jgi:hypothetical protein